MNTKKGMSDRTGLEIAVIGMAGRFPGARNMEEFWENLKNGIESISFFSDQELEEIRVGTPLLKSSDYVKAKGILPDIEYFDASFFGYVPFEAELMDPQVRFFHECSWEALENAGYDPDSYDGLIGVYAGASTSFRWEGLSLLAGRTRQVGFLEGMSLTNKDFLSTRLSYRLNLKGPSSFVQTACSTSLVAIHMACRAVLAGECHMALAGGVTISDYYKDGYIYQPDMILSPDGHNRTFDEKAKGTIPANGIGIVVLKWLKNAIRDRDSIYAIIKGSAINNDGKRKVGYMAPSVEGQAEVIRRAMAMARVESESISYLEAHGTATVLGDPVEIEALKLAFNTDRKRFCGIGSVKTNMGHLDSASGVAGFIKVVLALKKRLIPPNLHFTKPNPEIDFENSPFYVVNRLVEWKKHQYPLRAGVSSFGIGGTNAHVIIEEFSGEFAALPEAQSASQYQLLLLSAKTESALTQMKKNLEKHFKKNPDINLADAAYTFQVGRQDFPFRWMAVCSNVDEAIDILSANESGKARSFHTKKEKKIIFMFPGLGSQYVNMGLDLYKTQPQFREEADRCFNILNSLIDYDIKKILYQQDTEKESLHPSHNIRQLEIAQLAVFILEYALAQLIMKWGISPYAMIGYSFGEYVAACLSGVFSLEDALKLVVSRGKLIGKLPPGAMLSVPLTVKELKSLLTGHDGLSVAIDNGSSSIIAGQNEIVDAFEKEMKRKRYVCTRLPASHAIHSPMMEPILKEHEKSVAQVAINKPRIPYISNVTGTWINSEQVMNSAYWGKHLRETVRFADGIKELVKDNDVIFVEVGPGRDLSSLAMRYIEKNAGQSVLDLIRHPGKDISDVSFLLERIGRLWFNGIKPNWKSFYGQENRYRIPLPTYPFERQAYWFDKDIFNRDISSLTGKSKINEKKNLFYVPAWQPSEGPITLPGENLSEPDSRWLIFINESDFSSKLVMYLENRGVSVFCVKKSTGFEKLDEFNFTINPRENGDYRSLLHSLQNSDFSLTSILYLWGISGICRQELELGSWNCGQESLIYDLLHLAEAIGGLPLREDNQFKIIIVTNNMHALPGEEMCCPEKAPILAAVNMIPQLYPNIRCQNIDIVVPPKGTWKEEELIEHLLRELNREICQPVIAFRGHERLLQTYTPVQLSDTNHGKTPAHLKEKGVYVIIGDYKNIAGEIAQYLATLIKPKLLFIQNSVFYEPGKEEQIPSSHNNLNVKLKENDPFKTDINEEIDFLNNQQEIFEKQFAVKSIDAYEGLEVAINELCTCGILDYFRKSSIIMEEKYQHDLEELQKKLKILPKFNKFFNFFVSVLSEDQMIVVEDNKLNFLKAATQYKEPSALAKEIERKYPQFRGTIRLINYCFQHYPDALSGKMEAISVLYPGGDYIQTQEEFKDLVNYSTSPIYSSLFRELVSNVLEKLSKKKPIRILEIGGGRGLLTRILVPMLKGKDVIYHFTDIGNFFVINARKEAVNQELDFMEFGILDISEDPEEQGYEYYSFDMIVGLNVVHATRCVEESLKNLKKLLSPGGVLCLMELTNPKRWLNMIDGLAEGWWYFEDERTNLKSPLMSLDTWEHLFRKVGFQGAVSFPQDPKKRDITDYGLIIGRQENEDHCEGYGTNDREKYFRSLEKVGANVQRIDVDLTDIETLRREMIRVENNWGTICGIIQDIDIFAEKDNNSEILVETVEDILTKGIKSTQVLENIFKTKPLDFHVIFSSPQRIVNPTGKIENSALRHFFDFYAHYKRSREGRIVLSINWDPDTDVTVGNMFTSILQYRFPRVIVSSADQSKSISQTQGYSDPKAEKKAVSTPIKKYQRRELSSQYVAPSKQTEKVLANIWQEFLGIEQVGIYDDFLELGTDSLVFITIAAKIHKILDVKIPIPEFFAKPTIKDLSVYIESMSKEIFTSIEPVEKKEYYRLSSLQGRMYLMSQMAPDSTGYNFPLLLRVEGNVNIEKFEEISRKLIFRHESLRTSFTVIDDLPVQIVHDAVDFKISDSFLGGRAKIPMNGQSIDVTGIVKNFIRPFDLSKSPLLRIALIKEEEQKYILMVDMHHIIADGVSLNIFARDFMSLYAEEQLPPLRIQYKDYTQWESSEVGRAAQHRQAVYWHEQFSSEWGVPLLKLPTDFVRPQVQSSDGGAIEFKITFGDTVRLNSMASEHGTTLFVVLLSVFYVFLFKITHQEAIVVGTATAGRRHADLEMILGMFVNTLGIINFPQGHLSFGEFLDKVSETTWKAFENQDYPFEELVEHVVKERDPSRNPLFDVSLVFENLKAENIEIPGLKFVRMGFEKTTAQLDLSVLVFESSDGLLFVFEYCTKLFKKATIIEFENYFKKILSAILEDNNILLKDIEITHEYGQLESNTFDDGLGDF